MLYLVDAFENKRQSSYMMELAPQVQRTIDFLEARGYSAYLVGGSLRDTLIGVPVNDWDIACSAPPDKVKETFEGFKVIETGIKLGSLCILFDEGPVEVTTFRSEGEYPDHRHPADLAFVDTIEEDLARRDFTMNAIAFNPKTGFIDPYRGRDDIKAGLIRCVGDPDTRLKEDALRIMRALRFSATLGFSVDDGLSKSLLANKGLLTRIAPERVSVELMKMLPGNGIFSVLLVYHEVLSVVIPEIKATVGFDQRSRYHQYDIWEHTARAVVAAGPDPEVRLALLFHDLGKPARFFIDSEGEGHFHGHAKLGEEIARKRLKALKFSNSLIDKVATAICFHQIRLKPDNTRKWLGRLGEEMLRYIIEVSRADIAAHAENVVERLLEDLRLSEERLNELIDEGFCFKLADLAINGDDLKEIGLHEGKEIGRVLSSLLEMVIAGELENSREELLDAAEAGIDPQLLKSRE